MAVPFISYDRRADILSNLASSPSTEEAEGTKSSRNKLYSKEQRKDQKDSSKDQKDGKDGKDGKDSKDDKDDKDYENALGGMFTDVDEIIRAAGAEAAATDEAAGMRVGQKWVKPAEFVKRDPVV